jgi:transcription elongation GreA/GreB family factor
VPTAAEVVNDHRDHYLVRKLARSPLLHFYPGAYRIDLNSLFDGIQANLPTVSRKDSGISTPESLIRNLLGDRLDGTINGVRPAMLKKLERIQKAAADSIRSTGQHTLYVGYPCVVMPVPDARAKLAPILLFAVQILVDAKKVTIKRVVETAEDGTKTASAAIFNRLLAAYVEREFGVSLAENDREIETSGVDIDEKIKEIFAPWPNVGHRFKYPDVSYVPDSKILKSLDPGREDPYIADYAIIGLAEFSGQAMLDDLDKIIGMLEDGADCPDALKTLIKAAHKNSDNKVAEPNSESSKWLVEKSDPSQEKAVWAHAENYLTVIQGPPGTGKSQTIVNIVSDALAKGKSVLVVCQKRAAIDVVLKRLAAKQLGELAVLVDDIDKDRLGVIRKIDQIDREFAIPVAVRERDSVAVAIENFESKIDIAIEALNDHKDGARIRYGDIQALLKRLGLVNPSPAWTANLKAQVEDHLGGAIGIGELKEFVENIARIDVLVRRLRYGENLWSAVAESLAGDQQRLANIFDHVKTSSQFGKEIGCGAIEIQHSQVTQWIAEHPWLQNVETPFQGGALISVEERRRHYEKFQHWLKAITEIAAVNGNVKPRNITATIFGDGVDVGFCERLEQDSQDLRDLVALRDEIKMNHVLTEADASLTKKRGGWAPEIHAVALHNWRRELFQRNAEGFKQAAPLPMLISKLAQSLEKKRELDSLAILNKFDSRTLARNELKNKNLLRLRGRAGLPKTTLRHLYSNGLDELGRISPLLLVSPETASSMLPLRSELFDIVVIDEASQMFVAEAIPMLFRAKKVVIAGDSNQMPPADFFSYTDDDDDDGDANEGVEELANVDNSLVAADGVYRLLDAAEDALSAGAHSKLRLMVHYRSARKELIDFSNHAFYEGRLIIPSGNAALPPFMRTAIEFEAVEGSFKKGVNEQEAARIVEILRNIWTEPDDSRPSVGVIVANVKQRDRIVELMQELSESNATFGRSLERESERKRDGEDASFFVRSVEHVQGDERDVIIFGLTYSGSSRSFGPLNTKNDGRKRLNVAITRAKSGMIVLSSLNINHISNASETGERYFVWQYLRYARAIAQNDFETKETVLSQLNRDRTPLSAGLDTTESPFEEDVKDFIESLGYYVECQVGESGFRIDLGVRLSREHPAYLCGIECDGARYHSGWRARTNDVWRQEILESKGWSIVRIWSTSWFDRPEKARQELAEKLGVLRQRADSEVQPERYQFIRRPPTITSNLRASKDGAAQQTVSSAETPNEGNLPVGEKIIELGDTVIYKYLGTDKVASSRVVSGPGNIDAGTINEQTPLAQSILGASEGAEIKFLSPGGEIRLSILSIKKSP